MRLSELTKDIPGSLIQDGEFICIAFATEREQPSFLTFLEKEKFLGALENPNISCVLTTPELAHQVPSHIQGIFTCERPKTTLFAIHNALAEDEAYVGKSFETRVGENCRISPLCYIDPQNVTIGNNVTIEPFAVIKGRVTIGNDVTIRSHAAIGCKGFSFSKNENGQNQSVIDTAQIVIEDHAEIFEQAAISTGIFPWEKTVIGRNTKIDTQSFIAHGSHIGDNCLIVEGTRCCGNCHIGHDVWIGAGAVICNRMTIGDGTRVSLGAVVTKNVPAGATVSGNFAIDHQKFLQNLKESIKE